MPDGTVTTLECPRDVGTMLVAVDRNGVMIDACPRCRGIWLDRGELDKLIDLESTPDEDFLEEMRGGPGGSEPDSREGSGHHSSGKHGSKSGTSGRKKRSGFLGEFFDFG